MRRLRTARAALLLVPALLLSACGAGLSETGEPLTLEQSEALAQARFQLATESPFVAVVASGAEDDVDRVVAELTVDAEDTLAWGTLERGPEGIEVVEDILLSAEGYATRTSDGWTVQPWTSGGASALAIVFSLTADRPENAQLLRQSDAAYLGEQDSLAAYRLPAEDGAGSGVTRLWLDDEGRIARLDTAAGGFTVDIDREAVPEPRPAELDDILGSTGE
ncbi:hypothetical protein [Microbacterium sp. NPDC055683]